MEHMFQRINENSDTQLTFRVECSMVEIYNERIRDLFVRFERGKEKKGGLKLRDSPKQGETRANAAAKAIVCQSTATIHHPPSTIRHPTNRPPPPNRPPNRPPTAHHSSSTRRVHRGAQECPGGELRPDRAADDHGY